MPDPRHTPDAIDAIDRIFAPIRARRTQQARPIEGPHAAHRCCGNRPPIDETAWLRHGRIIDTTGALYTERGEPTTLTLPHLLNNTERNTP